MSLRHVRSAPSHADDVDLTTCCSSCATPRRLYCTKCEGEGGGEGAGWGDHWQVGVVGVGREVCVRACMRDGVKLGLARSEKLAGVWDLLICDSREYRSCFACVPRSPPDVSFISAVNRRLSSRLCALAHPPVYPFTRLFTAVYAVQFHFATLQDCFLVRRRLDSGNHL